MDDDFESALVGVRADTAGFARDVAAMRGMLDDGLGAGAERAALRLETALSRAVRTGRFGFEELKGVALSTLDAIAAAALKTGVRSLLGGSGGSGGLAEALGGLAGGLLGGLPGRATGGPVSPGRAYVVGERGPELFVPATSGRIDAGGRAGSGVREVRVAITVNAAAGAAPAVLAQSGRQVARAVRAALAVE